MSTQGPDPALRTPTPEVLTEFILSLVQAFLRTGYYLPDHPQARKAKVGLYNRFKSLFAGRHELTFMLKEMGETQNILVDGPLPETQRLSTLMTKGMAEVYVPRLSKFLERKDLVSLTLKETMSEEEFSRFVDVMSEPSFQTLDSVAKNQGPCFAVLGWPRGHGKILLASRPREGDTASQGFPVFAPPQGNHVQFRCYFTR